MDVIRSFPLMILLLLFLNAFISPMIRNKKIIKTTIMLGLLISLILSIFTIYYTNVSGTFVFMVGHYDSPWGIELKIGVMESIMSVLFSFIGLICVWASIYSVNEEIKEKRVALYYSLISALMAALLGIVFSNDLFNCFVFIEITSIAACGIIIVKDKKENIKAALKYLILSSVGSGLVLMAIAFLYTITGNLNMDFIGKELLALTGEYSNTILIVLGLITVGLGVKSAMFPMHIWLPDAHTYAPSSASALLSSLVVKAYIVLYIKVIYRVFGFEMLNNLQILKAVLILGAGGMIYGSIMAIIQKDLKRMIAYSSVAQIGYIFLGIGLGNILGLVGALFHIIAHALTKSALFLTAGNIINTTKNKKIENLKGLGIEMPISFSIFTACGLSMIGIPFLIGFNSKWNFALAIIDSKLLFLIIILLASSLLNAVYYLPIIVNAFFGDENLKGKVFKSKEKKIVELIPVILVSLLIVYLGLFSRGLIELITEAVKHIV